MLDPTSRPLRTLCVHAAMLLFAGTATTACRDKGAPTSSASPKDDLPSLSIPAKADSPKEADAKAARGGEAPPGARAHEEEPSIDDDAPPAGAREGRRASAAGPATRKRRGHGRAAHGSEPSIDDEPSAPSATPGDHGNETGADLKVTRLVIARGVSGREPVGAAKSFRADDVEKLYAFVELANEARAEGEVTVTFTPSGGGPSHRTTLEVGPQRRWRTWAFTRKPKTPGQWTATVRDAGGQVLGQTSFEVTP